MSVAVDLRVHTEPKFRKHWLERRRATVALLMLTPALFATLGSPSPLVLHSGWGLLANVLGWLLFLSGAALRFWATLYVGGRKGDALVDSGPYSITRNPLYLGSILIALSCGCFLHSATLLAAMIPAGVMYLWFTLQSEARRLREKHGSRYDDYCRRVPMLWPDWRQWQSEATLEVDLHCLHIEAFRALRWLSVPLVTIVVMQLRTASWWPVWFNVP
ncbi:MAG: isoprenylcysteine carboxylmethyltransferase family protein [Planctomycetaceae bacterium]|nr:isoprenylcysteine carboxylmethyltransferase family protein [Planctomycetaceae bacterium]